MFNSSLRALLLLAAVVLATPADAANRFAICTTTCTWDNSSTAMWAAISGGTTGSSAPTSADTVTFDTLTCTGALTCTITVNANVAALSVTMGACTASTTGCILDFSANNNSPTFGSFSGTGTGTRNIKMGSGTWTITGVGTPWNMGTITGLTFNANTSTLAFTNTSTSSVTATMGALTYSAVTIAANSTGSGTHSFQNTWGATSLSLTAPINLQLQSSTTITLTNAPTWTGTSVSPIYISNSFAVSQSTFSIASGTWTCAWCSLSGIAGSGGATFTANNTFNLGNNSGITITPPSGGGRIIGG